MKRIWAFPIVAVALLAAPSRAEPRSALAVVGAFVAVTGAVAGGSGVAGAVLAEDQLSRKTGTFDERSETQNNGRLALGVAAVGAVVCGAGIALAVLDIDTE